MLHASPSTLLGVVFPLIQNIELLSRKGSGNIPTSTIFDSGSNTHLITNKLASELGLQRMSCSIKINTFSSTSINSTSAYKLKIIDRDQKVTELSVLGVDDICHNMTSYPPIVAARTFNKDFSNFDNINGSINLLIGMPALCIFPREIDRSEISILFESPFGTGFCVVGRIEPFKVIEANYQSKLDPPKHTVECLVIAKKPTVKIEGGSIPKETTYMYTAVEGNLIGASPEPPLFPLIEHPIVNSEGVREQPPPSPNVEVNVGKGEINSDIRLEKTNLELENCDLHEITSIGSTYCDTSWTCKFYRDG